MRRRRVVRRGHAHRPLWMVVVYSKGGKSSVPDRRWGPMTGEDAFELRETLEWQAKQRGLGEHVAITRSNARKARGKAELVASRKGHMRRSYVPRSIDEMVKAEAAQTLRVRPLKMIEQIEHDKELERVQEAERARRGQARRRSR
jgi:hypothetical protein